MELLVNSLIGMVLLVFDVLRGVLGWGDKALLLGGAGAAGAYLGTRTALGHHARTIAAREADVLTSRRTVLSPPLRWRSPCAAAKPVCDAAV